MRDTGRLCRVLLLAGALSLAPAALRADGGTMCLSERKGDYQITVFTSPAPPRAGPVDVSVLVQDAVSGEPAPQVRVLVRAAPRGRPDGEIRHPATSEAATNKLFRSAVLDLPEPGLWDVEVVVEDERAPVEVHFAMEAGESSPGLGEMAPWIAWPAAAILLFGVHQWLVRRRASRRPRPARA